MPAGKKVDLAILLGGGGRGKGNEMEKGEEMADDAELLAVAEELLSAVKSGDAQAIADALKASHTICGGMDEED